MRDTRCCSKFGGPAAPRCCCWRLLLALLLDAATPCCRRCCHSSCCCAVVIPATVRSSLVTCMPAQGKQPHAGAGCVLSGALLLHPSRVFTAAEVREVRCGLCGCAQVLLLLHPSRTCCATTSWNLTAASAKLPLSCPPSRSRPFSSRNRHSSSSPDAGPTLAPCSLLDRLCAMAAKKESCVNELDRSAVNDLVCFVPSRCPVSGPFAIKLGVFGAYSKPAFLPWAGFRKFECT
jgi:hypothetical protein